MSKVNSSAHGWIGSNVKITVTGSTLSLFQLAQATTDANEMMVLVVGHVLLKNRNVMEINNVQIPLMSKVRSLFREHSFVFIA